MRRTEDEKINVSSAKGVRIGIVAADYHKEIYQRLRDGAEAAFERAGGNDADVRVAIVDGIFDTPPLVAQMIQRRDIDAVVVIGCVVRGETRHDRFIVDAAFAQFAQLAAAHCKPVGLAVLTVECTSQAKARSGGNKGDAGAFAMNAVLRSHAELCRLRLMPQDGAAAVSTVEKKS
ncbi:MAG: 6,7-dimethyl-8-ribityllumazine synthase [Planctomycetota bacterium]|nr:MAG: 6,7-dimethyl-8-ribityllumazine synthase [Planctomycetota bacterium]